jgi:hypothetical protein
MKNPILRVSLNLSLPECLLWGLICLGEVIFNRNGLSFLNEAYKAILMALYPTDPGNLISVLILNPTLKSLF